MSVLKSTRMFWTRAKHYSHDNLLETLVFINFIHDVYDIAGVSILNCAPHRDEFLIGY